MCDIVNFQVLESDGVRRAAAVGLADDDLQLRFGYDQVKLAMSEGAFRDARRKGPETNFKSHFQWISPINENSHREAMKALAERQGGANSNGVESDFHCINQL